MKIVNNNNLRKKKQMGIIKRENSII